MIIGARLPIAGERNRTSHAVVSVRTERSITARFVKRAFDTAVSAVVAVLVAPLVLVFAVALAITFKAWPFFVQERVGQNGQTFRFIKLRTLPPTAPAYADKYAIQHLHIPKLGKFLRATHLDEMPQVFLVLIGKMSLVGPRPEMEHLHDQGDVHFARLRTNVRPGCAGLWQVGEHREGLIWEAPEYDVLYIRNQSFGFDLWILVRTALYMLHLAPSVAFNDIPKRFLKRQSEHVEIPGGGYLNLREVDLREVDVDVTVPRNGLTRRR